MGNPISQETFLERARARFGAHYDYSAIVYKSFKTPVKLRCTVHPVKWIAITPEKHLQTTGGCKFCLRERRIQLMERDFASAPSPDHPCDSPTSPSPSVLTPLLATRTAAIPAQGH